MPLTLIQNRDYKMANSFNLNTFLQEYKGYNALSFTAEANGKKAMEQREIQKAEEAVNDNGFLSLTLTEKLAELGVGEKVFQQIGDTAFNSLKGLVDPITDYLKKYENIFDQEAYKTEIQSYAKQMFFAKQALTEDASERITGQNFVYDM